MPTENNKLGLIKFLVIIAITCSGWVYNLAAWKTDTKYTADDVGKNTQRIEALELSSPQVGMNTLALQEMNNEVSVLADDVSEIKGDIKAVLAHLEWLRRNGG